MTWYFTHFIALMVGGFLGVVCLSIFAMSSDGSNPRADKKAGYHDDNWPMGV